MLKDFFVNIVNSAIDKAIEEKQLGAMEKNCATLVCEKPKNTEFGDFAINVSSLAREARLAPPVIAQNIAKYIQDETFETNIVAGFMNFKLKENVLNSIVQEVLEKKENYAKSSIGNKEKINLEYVSANPTGPFHIGHGRWAALGSTLASLMKYADYDVYQEFYINDAGAQIQRLARSLELRVRELKGEDIVFEEDLYPGDYVIDCAKKYIKENSTQDYGDYAKAHMLELQKKLLKTFKVDFDCFFSEMSLYENNEVESTVKELKQKNELYEKDDAIWFKSSNYGDTQDRVLKKADGTNTYLTADIAYHKNKFDRGFDKVINIWGADHHGYMARIRASMDALGYSGNNVEILLGQLVNIIQDGQAQRMGKRKKMVTLDELVEEVGTDATRFWMLIRSIDTTLDFDIDLAKSQSDKNPVFYVQYAHARACSILRRAVEKRVDVENKTELEPYFTQGDIDLINEKTNIEALFEDNQTKESIESTKNLILKLEESKSLIENAAKNRTPYLLCKYATDLATDFHSFYNFSRVLSDDLEISKKRLALTKCFKIILGKMLDILGVEAVEKM